MTFLQQSRLPASRTIGRCGHHWHGKLGGTPRRHDHLSLVRRIVLARDVLVLALQGAFDLGLSALLDTLGTANELATTMDAPTAAIDERPLARRLRTVLGKSPLSYFQDLRVERAVHLLQTSNTSVDRIASEIGYSDGVTLRTLLRRKLGRGVREIRSRHR
jgi:hypothetical protein